MRRTPVVTIALPLLLVVILTGCAAGLPDGVVYPSIEPAEGTTRSITRAFTFEGEPVSLTATVDSGVYAGATAAEKSVIRFGGARETDWIEDYYPAFVDEEHQAAFYDSLLAALRVIRDARGLDADRYAELITVFVQSLTYATDPVDLSPKFPIETFVDGVGDCDDKTLLLAGLLSREGYDVAIILFEPEQHVALGIRSSDLPYRDTGYAFVETTDAGFIGMVPETLAGGTVLESAPRLFAVGTGTRAYTAGDEVRAILDARERAIADAEAMSSRIGTADAALQALETETRSAGAELESLRAAGRIGEYNAAVPEYNALVERYNAAARERNDLAAQYNALAEFEQLIVEGLDDRAGTYAAVASSD
jgi:hypothetical protein